MEEDVDLLHKGGMSCHSSLPSLAPRWLQKGAYRAFPRFLLFAACAYVLQHTWNTDRDIGFSQRQTLIADTGLPSLTHKMASTIFLHGAHDQLVGAGDRSFVVRVDTLMDSIQLIRTDLRPLDGILRIPFPKTRKKKLGTYKEFQSTESCGYRWIVVPYRCWYLVHGSVGRIFCQGLCHRRSR